VSKVRKVYTQQFKEEAVQLLETSGRSANQLEKELVSAKAVSPGGNRGWPPRVSSLPGHGRLPADQQRLRQLERENEILRQERDILKKPSPSSRAQSHEVPVDRRSARRLCDHAACVGAGCVGQRLLCLANTAGQRRERWPIGNSSRRSSRCTRPTTRSMAVRASTGNSRHKARPAAATG